MLFGRFGFWAYVDDVAGFFFSAFLPVGHLGFANLEGRICGREKSSFFFLSGFCINGAKFMLTNISRTVQNQDFRYC